MKQLMVRYKVKPDLAEENAALVRDVFDELNREDPGGFRYATYQLDDGVSFVHLVTEEGEGKTPLSEMPAFRQFQEGIRDRCEELPVVSTLSAVGSYR
jgi:hypothetical protein